jgi:hypothetical protein
MQTVLNLGLPALPVEYHRKITLHPKAKHD